MTIRIIKTKCTKCRKETNHEVKTPSFEEGYMNLLIDGREKRVIKVNGVPQEHIIIKTI